MTPRSLLRPLAVPLVFILCSAAPRPQPTAWAVIIGINDYEAFGDEPGGDLRGAENDALAFRNVIIDRWDIPEANTRLLSSSAATREAIRSAVVDWLGANVRPGDLAIFYFAGHGSQVLDMDGDEEDGTDETICPFDVMRASAARDIRDDELRDWLAGLPTREIVVILDSCHSGTATRVAGYMRARTLARRAAVSPTTTGVAKEPDAGGAFITDTTSSVIEIASASPNQVAMDAAFDAAASGEAGAYYGGAFTTHLVRQLRVAPRGTSYRRLFHATVVALKADGFAQDPQLSGRISGPAFRPVHAPAAPVAPPVASGPPVRDSMAAHVAQATTTTGRMRVHFDAGLDAAMVLAIAAAADVDAVRDSALAADLYVVLRDTAVAVLTRDGSPRAQLPLIGKSVPSEAVALTLARAALLKQLASLEQPDGGFQVEVLLSGGKREFEVGDVVTFSVRTERPGYLTLLDLGTDGTVTMLVPNRAFDVGRLAAGETVEIPGHYLDAVFNAAPPLGVGLVRAIVSDVPLDLPADWAGIAALRRALDNVSSSGVGAAGWSTAVTIYEIR